MQKLITSSIQKWFIHDDFRRYIDYILCLDELLLMFDYQKPGDY